MLVAGWMYHVENLRRTAEHSGGLFLGQKSLSLPIMFSNTACVSTKHTLQCQTNLESHSDFYFLFYFICLFVFLGLHSQHMEVPRSHQNYGCWPTPQPRQHGIWPASVTYTTSHGNAGSVTHCVRPGIEPATLWLLVGFGNHWATTGTPHSDF